MACAGGVVHQPVRPTRSHSAYEDRFQDCSHWRRRRRQTQASTLAPTLPPQHVRRGDVHGETLAGPPRQPHLLVVAQPCYSERSVLLAHRCAQRAPGRLQPPWLLLPARRLLFCWQRRRASYVAPWQSNAARVAVATTEQRPRCAIQSGIPFRWCVHQLVEPERSTAGPSTICLSRRSLRKPRFGATK